MDPGDYLTNVLSFNTFSCISYEYYELQNIPLAAARKQLQRLEVTWRQRGLLVYSEASRDGIWVFHGASLSPSSAHAKNIEPLNAIEVQASGLVQKEKGNYEPASLARSKQNLMSTANTPSNSSSPSSSQENAFRSAQALNARSIPSGAVLNGVQDPFPTSPGLKSGIGADLIPSPKHLHEYFVSAVLGSIVYFLCHDHDFIPLNSRTLILNPISEHLGTQSSSSRQPLHAIELVTIDISLTSLGALVVKAQSNIASSLQRAMADSVSTSLAESIDPGVDLWLAPRGIPAKFYGTPDGFKMPVGLSSMHTQPNTGDQKSSSFNFPNLKSWQSKCLDWLSTKGLNVEALENGGWLFVQVLSGLSSYMKLDYPSNPVLEDLIVIPWPAVLCFPTSRSSNQNAENSEALKSFRDPLAFAEEWFCNKDERANVIAKRHKDRQARAAEALSREQAEIEARNLQINMHSPVALRRGSNAGAMYPTPPDAPQHLIGATPTFDGTASTPGNPNIFTTHETIGLAGTTGAAGDVDIWGSSSSRKDRLNPGINFNDTDHDTDNLFGDLGGDIFGADITDADFSFFDEPDTIQLEQKPSSPAAVAPVIEQESHDLERSNAFHPAPITAHTTSDIVMQDLALEPGNPKSLPIVTPSTGNSRVKLQELKNSVTQSAMQAPTRITQLNVPFDKESIFRRLARSQINKPPNKQPRRASLFNKIDFEESLLSIDEKYGTRGQFQVIKETNLSQSTEKSALPQTHYLQNRRKPHESKSGPMGGVQPSEISLQPPALDDPMDVTNDSDSSSQSSEQDDASQTTDNPSPLQSGFGVKRKWDFDEADRMSTSLDALAMDFEPAASTPLSMIDSQLQFLETDPADWSLANYFNSPEPDMHSNALSDLERIATAQILADQAASSTLLHYTKSSLENTLQIDKVLNTKQLVHSLAEATKVCLAEVGTCTLRSFLEIQGLTVLTEGLRLPQRPNLNPRTANIPESARAKNPFGIPPPKIEIRRADSKLAVLSSAVPFWDNLGLGPAGGSKDINAVCIFPSFEGVADYAHIFLDQMRSIYESSRLGCHDRITGKDLTNGLLPFSIDPTQHNKYHYLTVLNDIAARLSRVLASLVVEEKNFVVYFAYPVDNGPLLVHICSAFQHLFNLYRKALSDHRITPANELVLQLIPLNFITSSSSLAVPSPTEYFHLAMEVYDRCVDFASSTSTPAIMLEQPLPKSIDFKLISNPSVSLLQENTCLHVAYSQSIDDRWITAAWTDNRGTQQMIASYCLGRKNEAISMPFSDVANEIWQTTLDLISSKKIHWRIMITRVGAMDHTEIETWTGLAAKESDALVNLTLITVQTDPSLQLLPPAVTLSPSGAQPAATPVSTPQNLQSSILSPENATTPTRDNIPPATPIDQTVEPDTDARLVDYTDLSWGAVLSHRLNNSNSLLDLNLALISGYLIKRGGLNNDDPPIIMEVNIVHSEVVGNPRTFHESLLRELLGYYRGLGTLARIRGCVDGVKDVRPWHVAAVEKAVRRLYVLM